LIPRVGAAVALDDVLLTTVFPVEELLVTELEELDFVMLLDETELEVLDLEVLLVEETLDELIGFELVEDDLDVDTTVLVELFDVVELVEPLRSRS
jgi:hypothetical protein